eukprot:GHUV01020181.1.p1 GENE.GHUV01020181.1~~GHUV01020181.1.p1  ORF type:complete len:201 (+),score=74.41 GHUV01020181.1:206-808(+)
MQKLPVLPEELEFFAEEELLQIVPNCSVPGKFVQGILGEYGPFEPNRAVEVPAWLALQLHKRNKARILVPSWLTCESLDQAIEQERSSLDAFSQQPYYFMELACLLLEGAKDSFTEDNDYLQVREKLATLVNVRRHKMEDGLGQIAGTATVRVNGLGAYELNLMRTNFQGALNMFLKLETVEAAVQAPPLSSAFGTSSVS